MIVMIIIIILITRDSVCLTLTVTEDTKEFLAFRLRSISARFSMYNNNNNNNLKTITLCSGFYHISFNDYFVENV